MNRALALLVLTVAIAGGLGYFALTGPGSRPAAGPGEERGGGMLARGDTGTGAVAPSPSRADLAAVNPDGASLDVDRGGAPARQWEIIPMNQVGQPIATAKITATRGGETRSAEGRVRWTQVPSGTWQVVIEAENQPRYETEVTLEPEGRTRTVARLGHGFRIQGRVVDTFGQPIARSTVYFLPRGIGHPMNAVPLQKANRTTGVQGSEKSGGGSDGWKAGKGRASPTNPTSETVAIQTDAGGLFRAVLPKADSWRVSLGPLGDARWTQKQAMELKNGGPDTLLVTIPALAHMTLKFNGPESARPSKVTVYRFDAARAALAASKGGGGSDGGDQAKEARALKEAEMIAKKRAMERRTPGGAKTGGGKNTASQAEKYGSTPGGSDLEDFNDFGAGGSGANGRPVNMPLFEPGWRPVRSAPFTAAETILSDLPGQEDLKFLFVRGTERISTSATTRLRDGERSVGAVSLPRPAVGSADALQSNLATISLRILPKDESADLEPGVVLTSNQ